MVQTQTQTGWSWKRWTWKWVGVHSGNEFPRAKGLRLQISIVQTEMRLVTIYLRHQIWTKFVAIDLDVRWNKKSTHAGFSFGRRGHSFLATAALLLGMTASVFAEPTKKEPELFKNALDHHVEGLRDRCAYSQVENTDFGVRKSRKSDRNYPLATIRVIGNQNVIPS